MKAIVKACPCPVLLLILLPMFASCYSPRPLDGNAMLRELRESTTAQGKASGSALTEEEAVRQAVESAPGVRTARAAVAEADGEVSRIRSVDNPEVRVDNGYQRRGNDNYDRDVYKLDLDFRVKLPPLAELGARVGAAKAEVSAAQAAVKKAEAFVRREVRVAFAQVSAARQKETLLDRLVAVRRERETILARSVEGGYGVAADQAMASAGVGDALDRVGRAREDAEDALDALGRVLGSEVPSAEVLSLPAEPTCHTPPDDIEAVTQRALSASPELGLRRARHLRAQEEARAENLAWIPSIKFVEVGYSRNFLLGTKPLLAGYEIEPRYYAWAMHLGLGIELPLWNWNQGRVKAAEARVEGETARFRETLVGTVSSLHRFVTQWRDAHEGVQHATASMIPAAEAAAFAVRQAVDSGRMPATAALDAEERLLMARVRRVNDLRECRIAEIEVETALGQAP